jgi:hypothetical protein
MSRFNFTKKPFNFMEFFNFLKRRDNLRSYGTTHPLNSNTVYGLLIGVIAPVVTQIVGVDVVSLIDLIKQIQTVSNTHYNFWEVMQLVGQISGIALIVRGTLTRSRKPLSL